jgi:hypothetical protein
VTTDRELLEAAAKAAGDAVWPFRGYFLCWSGEPRNSLDKPWNPLTDDGDTQRLSVKLNLTTTYDTLPDGPIVKVAAPWSDDFKDYWWIEWLNKDPAAAARRAVVRAAAELGKST